MMFPDFVGFRSKVEEVVLAVVACGDRLDETLVMLKSALTFTQAPLRFIIFAEDDLIESFNEKVY
jgi:UDP-xylose:glucoside alpha-1,3-xylosyltransferase